MNKSKINNTKPIHKKDQVRASFCNDSQNRNPIANVLIVDDDHESTRFLLEILARKAICGTVADNKKTVVDFLNKNSYNLVFSTTRINQPEDGFNLVRQIKANSPEMPVIMIGDAQKQKTQYY